MGKFVYIYKLGHSNWDHQAQIIRKCLEVPGLIPLERSSMDQFLWINNAKGMHVDGFSLATGVIDLESSIQGIKHFSFKLLSSGEEVTMESDSVASRTIWFCVNNQSIIISSSQRVIISLIGNLDLNRQAVSWMLCSGNLGPDNSWDKRIRPIPPNSILTFKKSDFSLSEEKRSIVGIQQQDKLQNTFDRLFKNFKKNKNWGITLSGGYDSRAVLVNLVKNQIQVESFSWGLRESLSEKYSDSAIANQVATALEVPFNFMELSYIERDPAIVLGNFINYGEGRIDHVNAFCDGLDIWHSLSKRDIEAIIRSDEAFGWINSKTEKDVRISLDLNLTGDYENVRILFMKAGSIEPPKWPAVFSKIEGESLQAWRDRLYRSYRLPYILAALHDLMLPFVEIVNPLLNENFISWIDKLSDDERTDKRLFKSFFKDTLPNVPYAKVPSIPEPGVILSQEGYRKEIIKIFETDDARSVLGSSLVDQLMKMSKRTSQTKLKHENLLGFIKSKIPFEIKKLARKRILPYKLDNNRLLFRAYIVVAMKQRLDKDVQYANQIVNG